MELSRILTQQIMHALMMPRMVVMMMMMMTMMTMMKMTTMMMMTTTMMMIMRRWRRGRGAYRACFVGSTTRPCCR